MYSDLNIIHRVQTLTDVCLLSQIMEGQIAFFCLREGTLFTAMRPQGPQYAVSETQH